MNFPWISHDFPIVPTIFSHVTSPFVGATACLLQYRSQRHFAAGTEPNRAGSLIDPNEATPSKTTFFLLKITKTQRWFWWFCQRKWIVLDGFGMLLFRKNHRNYEAVPVWGRSIQKLHKFLATSILGQQKSLLSEDQSTPKAQIGPTALLSFEDSSRGQVPEVSQSATSQ